MASDIGEAGAPLLPEQRKSRCGATSWQTLGHIVVSIVGTGVLGLPYAFKAAGWLGGSLGIAFVGISTYYAMTLLVECRRRVNEEKGESIQIQSYGDLGCEAFGRKGRYLTDVLVFVAQAGGVIAYIVFISQNLSSVLSTDSRQVEPSSVIFFFLLPVEIALSFIKSFKALAPFSVCANLCNGVAMLIVIKENFQFFGGFSETGITAFNGIRDLLFAVGFAIFCFEGFSMTLPLEASMAERKTFQLVLSRALSGITVVYVCFGFSGYMAYGDQTRDIVTLNILDEQLAITVKFILSVALIFALPMMMHPIHDIAEARLKDFCWFYMMSSPEWFGIQLVRILCVAVMAVLASSVPAFGAFVSFVGSTVCALLSFALPASFHLALMGSSLSLFLRLVDWIILVFGLLFAVYGTYSAATGSVKG